jgi:steroid delta-isomerase-like uncharacterized protein
MSIDITTAPRRFAEEAINQQRLDMLDELFAPDYTNHGAPPGSPQGPDGERAFAGMFLAAFPDLQLTIEDVFGCGDKVAARSRFTGTHTGDFMGIPATGKAISVGSMNIFRVRDGKITDNWNQFDMLGLLQQLGVIPAQG